MTWPTFVCGFMCAECPYGCETLESAMDHTRNTGHPITAYFKGAYHPAIHRHTDGSVTYSPPGKEAQ